MWHELKEPTIDFTPYRQGKWIDPTLDLRFHDALHTLLGEDTRGGEIPALAGSILASGTHRISFCFLKLLASDGLHASLAMVTLGGILIPCKRTDH